MLSLLFIRPESSPVSVGEEKTEAEGSEDRLGSFRTQMSRWVNETDQFMHHLF